ncbi:MAG: hypothetical protein L0191_10250 [Acidobacteria bacterium]|nr:hypothetical protein [Acidobacteriota bacterium]
MNNRIRLAPSKPAPKREGIESVFVGGAGIFMLPVKGPGLVVFQDETTQEEREEFCAWARRAGEVLRG